MLEVRLIGKFEIKYGGKPVNISSRVAQSLFAFLILNAGTSHRREKLAGMFWPDITEEKARAYLRHELWRIRKALPSSDFLLSNDIGITFDSSANYWLDADMLAKLEGAASADELIVALSTYQGELLSGFYEEWIVLEREHLHAIYEQMMARLLELLESEKRWSEILDWAERWILLGQAPEAAFRALMVAYDALGDRAKVASTYKRCKQALQELGLEPSEETQALAFRQTSSLNIPVPFSSFIGRKKELKEVVGLLSKFRLVTLTGVGGVGKTRLAMQVVLEVPGIYPDGIWFLDLAFLSGPAHMPNTLASLLGIRDTANPTLSAIDLLKGYLRSRKSLLIFDNCEHLIEACAQLADSLLQACQSLRILATSREPLRIAGEMPYRVPSLEVPRANDKSPTDVLANIESVRLFIERAASVSRTFVISLKNVTTIAQICQRLDGIPLAIELAAARVNTLSVEQILNRLDDRFNLLSSGLRSALARHQTLRATIEWSYSLLSEQERLLFRRLAVFVGGWTLEAAEEVCRGNVIKSRDILDLLSQLVNKSLVLVETFNGDIRYRRLETIRQFTREKFIESGEEENVRTRHLDYFLHLAEQAESALRGSEQKEWYVRLSHERDNLRAALEWADKSDVEAGLFLSGRLYRIWEFLGFREGSYWLSKFLQNQESQNYLRARAKALYVHGRILVSLRQSDAALSVAKECLELYRAFRDQQGEVDGLLLLASILSNPAQKLELNQEALKLAQSLRDVRREVIALWQLGWLYQGQECFIYWEKAITLARSLGDLRWLASSLSTMGFFLIVNGDLEAAQKYLEQSETFYQQLNMNPPPAHLFSAYGQIALLHGDFEKARAYLQESARILHEIGSREGYLWDRARLGYVALREDNLEEARTCFSEVARSFQEDKYEIGVVYALEGMANLFVITDWPERAALLIGWADATREKISDTRPLIEQSDVDRDITAMIAKIGNVAFKEVYKAGRIMTLDEAVAFALEESQ